MLMTWEPVPQEQSEQSEQPPERSTSNIAAQFTKGISLRFFVFILWQKN